ncbi:MerR family transcriptional regulator [Intrasporangium mesophilum]
MRISELADLTGVSIPTLKYYLREGLLPAGEAQGATRASYDERHVERVRLIRTLVDVGRLSIERVREVVAALDDPPGTRHELLGTAHAVLRSTTAAPEATEPSAQALAQVDRLGLPRCESSSASTQLARALTDAEAAGWPLSDASIDAWYAAMLQIAQSDVVPELADMSPGDALRYVVVGNVLTDPVVIALRRAAQEIISSQRLDRH